jgi:hypothetical protein
MASDFQPAVFDLPRHGRLVVVLRDAACLNLGGQTKKGARLYAGAAPSTGSLGVGASRLF